MSEQGKDTIFSEFQTACREGKMVFVTRGALETAKTDFNLNTNSDVIYFVGNGLDKPKFISSKKWENNPDKAKHIDVHNWSFYSNVKFGYLSFFFQPKNSMWNIKSLKLNEQPDERNLVFKDLKKLLANNGGTNE